MQTPLDDVEMLIVLQEVTRLLLLQPFWFIALVTYYDLDPSQPYNYPLICVWIGSCCYTLFSSMAHLTSNKSLLVHKVGSMVDYLGIAIYGLGLNIAGLFYLSSSSSLCFIYRNIVLALEVCLALFAAIVGCLSYVFWRHHQFTIKTLGFTLPYVTYISLFLHRQCVCWLYGTDCVSETEYLHYLSMLFCALGTFF